VSARCDACGTGENVKRAFMTMWNGNIVDLCGPCAQPFIKLVDSTLHAYEGKFRWPDRK
jgi:hypothetical protein